MSPGRKNILLREEMREESIIRIIITKREKRFLKKRIRLIRSIPKSPVMIALVMGGITDRRKTRIIFKKEMKAKRTQQLNLKSLDLILSKLRKSLSI